MSYFLEEDLADLEEKREELLAKYHDLAMPLLTRTYLDSRAKELGTQALARRLRTLVRCIENVFRYVPPEGGRDPTPDERHDCEINLQAFMLNVFAALDNLAQLWVYERGVKRPDGRPIPPSLIGFGKKCEVVRDSLPQDLKEYLSSVGMERWLSEYLENYRHALAHRVPLYIPPFVLPESKQNEYQELGRRADEAAGRGDWNEYYRLTKEQEKLGIFRPWMKHSFEEGSWPVIFHGQIIADFLTIEEITQKVIKGLDGPLSTP